jgi:hypothetical protein
MHRLGIVPQRLLGEPFRVAALQSPFRPRIPVRMQRQLPARLTAEQAAWVLNCQPHDVPILVAASLLKPLGNPPPNSVKFFAASELLELVQDRGWLAKVTNGLNQHWQKKNAAKRNRPTVSLTS